jgi:hypothetical protein
VEKLRAGRPFFPHPVSQYSKSSQVKSSL